MKTILREVTFVFGVFLLALTYNLFLLPNNLIIGGTTGLSIIFKKSIEPTIFIYGSTFLLVIISYIFLGKEISNKTLFGSILYPVFVSLSAPMSKMLLPYFSFDEYLLTIIVAALFYGVGNGVVFRTGYTTGGFDVIAGIIQKYLKMPQAQALFWANCVVIILGGFIFGFNGVIYALIVMYVGSAMTNKIVIGISESKIFFIYTRKTEEIKSLIVDKLQTGYTVLPTVGGYSHTKSEMIMCVLPTRDYYLLKELVLEIDDKAFIVVNDCYDVNGGVQKVNRLS